MQSIMCLTTNVCLTADPGVPSYVRARSHTFIEIDEEFISTFIFKKGCCQLQAKVCL